MKEQQQQEGEEEATSVTTTIIHYLVTHPRIRSFKWDPPNTFLSSPESLWMSILGYLCVTLVLSQQQRRLIPSRRITKAMSAVHSLTLSLLSLLMFLGCTLSILLTSPDFRYLVCFPPHTIPSGPFFFWAYVFYLSKLLELGDTFLIIASGSFQRLTFLHVYHHATVLIMSFLWLHTSQSLFPIALLTNAGVHVLMYSYYMLCALGFTPKWKRLVTHCQILQFVFSFFISGFMLYYHFQTGSEGCCGMSGWCFNAVFNASLLGLFVNFHGKSYSGKDKSS